jgi:hypothetical protein
VFDENSRYANAPRYTVRDRRGRTVTVVAVPAPPEQSLAGYHLLKQGQRLDHLAHLYLDDGNGFWRIAEENDAQQAEWLTEAREVAIPGKGR